MTYERKICEINFFYYIAQSPNAWNAGIVPVFTGLPGSSGEFPIKSALII
jgi:hypothetical protein